MKEIGQYKAEKFLIFKNLIILFGASIVILNDKLITVFKLEVPVWYGLLLDKYFIFQGESGKEIEVINLINLKKENLELSGFLHANCLTENELLILNSQKEVQKIDSKLKVSGTQMIGRVPRMIINDLILRVLGNSITIHLENGSIKWQLSFQDLLGSANARLFSEIIHYNGKLFFYLSDLDRKKGTFVVDVQTGRLLHRTYEFSGWLTFQNEKIYVADWYKVSIMNVETFETETIDFTEVLEPLDINMQWNSFIPDGQYLYFTCFNKPGVGILDLESRGLLWYKELKVENEHLQKVMQIKLNHKRLFVNTSDDKLHIFEKE